MAGPLAGLVVADFTQLAQGPFATRMMGDLGAEIVKIEPVKGDWMRHWSMANLYIEGEGLLPPASTATNGRSGSTSSTPRARRWRCAWSARPTW